MIVSFADAGTENIFAGRSTRGARKSCPVRLWPVARRKSEYLDSATALTDLRQPLGNRLEALQGSRDGQHGIRVNDRYRLCFRWTRKGPADVEIVDYP
jgi:proteic killer suppression protein